MGAAMPKIDTGKKAPAFSLKDQDEQVHKLSDYAGAFFPVSILGIAAPMHDMCNVV